MNPLVTTNKINRIQSEQDKISEPFGHYQQWSLSTKSIEYKVSKIKLVNPLVTVNKINRIQSEQDKISEPFGHCQQNQ